MSQSPGTDLRVHEGESENRMSHSLEYSQPLSDELSDEIAFAIANWSPIPGSGPRDGFDTTKRPGTHSILRGSKDLSSPTRFFLPPALASNATAPPVEDQ